MNLSELFWKGTLEDIKRGYVYVKEKEEFICLICGKIYEKDQVYKDGEIYYQSEKAVKQHIEKNHGSMFHYLISMDKKYTGLTELQRNLLVHFYNGLSDGDIVKELEGGSTSTIRNHRFNLKEKEKQAKVYLSIMELLSAKQAQTKNEGKENFIEIHRSATMVDERYAITQEENDKILNKYFTLGLDGPLSQFPIKEKRKLIILRHIVKQFDHTKKYHEKEVSEIIKRIYPDFVTIRRYLIEYGFLDRVKDGSQYWVKL